MKPVKIVAASLALACAMAVPALAAQDRPAAPLGQQSTNFCTIQSEGKTLPDAAYVMVPLRSVAESLGFQVTWRPDGVLVDNGVMHTTVTIGLDSYQVVTSNPDLVGMSAPFSLGLPPILVEGVTYVPANLFQSLLGNGQDSVTLQGSTVTFQSKRGEAVQMPNPRHDHDSIEALAAAVSFPVVAPAVPDGYTLTGITDIGGNLAELVYTNSADQTITYRVSNQSGDISGDFNQYDKTDTRTIQGVAVTCRGGDLIQTATWEANGYSYAVTSTQGLTQAQLETLAFS